MRIIAAATLVALSVGLGGCLWDAPQAITPLARSLPEWPAMCKPVKVTDPKTHEELLVIAARERAGRVKANKVITSCAEWYAHVKESYESPQ